MVDVLHEGQSMTDQAEIPINLLLVDDEPSVVNALRRSLRREGYTIFTTTDPEEGMQIVGREKIDIVISDHLMPQMTGLEFFTLLSRLHSHVVRIVLTGQADVDMAIRAINEGHVQRFLTKPWEDDELKHILRETAREITVRKRQKARELELLQPAAASAEKSSPAAPQTIKRDSGGAIVLDELAG